MGMVEFFLERERDTAVLQVRGSLDAYGATDLADWLDRLLSEDAPRLVVDLTSVVFVDTTSAGALTRLPEAITGGAHVEVVVQSAQVIRMLDTLGLTELVPTTVVVSEESVPA